MAIKIVKHKKPSKNPSYKGGITLSRKEDRVYKGDKFYIKYPVIDKITLLGNASFNADDEGSFKRFIYSNAKAVEDGEIIEYPAEWHHFKNKQDYYRSRYKHHFKIRPPNSGGRYALLSFKPLYKQDGQRFLKLEFNPAELGKEGVQYVKDWYDANIIHSKFTDLISYKNCIGKLDIAIDIVGIDIADLILNYKSRGKSQRWYSQDGLLETYYPHNDKPPSDIIIYDKTEDDEEASQERYSSQKRGVRKYPKPITRVEKTVKTERPLTELHNLKPHFKDMEIHLPLKLLDSLCFLESEHHWLLFLDSVRCRGLDNTLKLLPEPLRNHYESLLKQNIENIFSVFTSPKGWREIWTESINRSGLL